MKCKTDSGGFTKLLQTGMGFDAPNQSDIKEDIEKNLLFFGFGCQNRAVKGDILIYPKKILTNQFIVL